MANKKVKEFSEVDWDLYRYYRLGSFNLIEVRNFLKLFLDAYLNNAPVGSITLNKVNLECIFRFLQQSQFGYVSPNKKSKICRSRKKTR